MELIESGGISVFLYFCARVPLRAHWHKPCLFFTLQLLRSISVWLFLSVCLCLSLSRCLSHSHLSLWFFLVNLFVCVFLCLFLSLSLLCLDVRLRLSSWHFTFSNFMLFVFRSPGIVLSILIQQSICHCRRAVLVWHCLLGTAPCSSHAGTLSPYFNSSWPSGTSFLWCWALSTPC